MDYSSNMNIIVTVIIIIIIGLTSVDYLSFDHQPDSQKCGGGGEVCRGRSS